MPDRGEGRKPSRGLRLTMVLSAFVACIAAIIGLIIMVQPPPPAAIVLVGADYATNLAVPPNVLGVEGLKQIAALARRPPGFALIRPRYLELIRDRIDIIDRADQWDTLISSLTKDRAFPQKTLVLFVSLHGGSDASGAYLIPNLMTRPEERLDLKQVIESMRRLPEQKNKILILEGAQVPSHWPLGMLHNDFARRLAELEPDIRNVKNLWVLSSAGVDQRSWASEGLGRTIFQHYFLEALRLKKASSSSRLTLGDLTAYLQRNVRNWAWFARGAIQSPVLLPGVDSDRKRSGSSRTTVPSDVFLATPSDVPPAASRAPLDRTELRKAWQRFAALDRQVPHPADYSPRRWREYRATLVRYEELVRAGAAQAAETMAGRLNALERSLGEERYLKRVSRSVENTLAMNAVRGGPVPEADPNAPELIRLWKAPTQADAVKVWDGIKQGGSGTGDILLPPARSRAADFLVQLAIAGPVQGPENLSKAAVRLRAVKGVELLPAEAQLLVMLDRYPPPADQGGSAAGLVYQALTVRRQAERAALGVSPDPRKPYYSEQIVPWIRPLIEQADEQRRRGEDLLFSAAEQDRRESNDALSAAQTLYQKALARADELRAALAVRNRVTAELPDYARWAAQQADAGLIKPLQDLWGLTHELVGLLETPTSGEAAPGEGIDEEKIGAIRQKSKDVETRLNLVAKKFLGESRQVSEKRGPGDWEPVSAATEVTAGGTGDLALRETLWNRLDDIGKHDIELTGGGAKTPNLSQSDRNEAVSRVRRRAQAVALMALAALGQPWFDRPQFGEQEGFAAALDQIEKRGADKDEWWKAVAAVGGQVGKRWFGMPAEIKSLVGEEDKVADFKAYQGRLRAADRLGRFVDAATFETPSDTAPEASIKYRESLAHDLLVWMARRTWRDHWYDEAPDDKPYYESAAMRFVDDARSLSPRSADNDEAEKRIQQRGRLAFNPHERLVYTSEPGLSITYEVVAKGEVPPGLPVVKGVPDSVLELAGPGAAARVVPGDKAGNWSGRKLAFAVSSPLMKTAEKDLTLTQPRTRSASFIASGFFRGQVFDGQTEVVLHPLPEVVAIGPAPPDPPLASVAVRADRDLIKNFGEGTGSIAIVLDCSGSMRDSATSTRFSDAKGALKEVLSSIPNGTTLSLWVFGQAREGIDPGRDLEAFRNPERTITPLRKPSAWDRGQLNGLVQQLARLNPYFGTPLVRAMSEAKADLVGAKGLKTLVVITDGSDSRFLPKPESPNDFDNAFNPKQIDIATFLRQTFDRQGIAIDMIFFGESGELVLARKQFEKVLPQLEPAGRFVPVQKLEELIVILRNSLNQKLKCQILKPDGTPVAPETLDVTLPEEDLDRWWSKGLDPGAYELEIRADKLYRQEISLARGDRLVVQLGTDPQGRITFNRMLYSDNDQFSDRVKAETADWRLAVLSSGAPDSKRKTYRAMATLEPLRVGEGRLREILPRFTWLQLEPQEPQGAAAVRWRLRPMFPAPVWQIDSPQWAADAAGNGPARPMLRAWWAMDEATLPSIPLNLSPGQRIDQVEGLEPRDADGTTVTVESIRFENHYIEPQPGTERRLQPCLVVRLAYPANHPFLVDPAQLSGLSTTGYEHRFYTSANKYTGVFWPVDSDQAAQLKGLSLIALSRFQAEAEKGNRFLEIKNMRPPTTEMKPLEPPEAIVR